MDTDIQWARPRDVELDLFGITHIGLVRKENQDHFMLCTVHPQVVVHGTSLPDADKLPLRGERLATYMLVADGVGGGSGGGDASRLCGPRPARPLSPACPARLPRPCLLPPGSPAARHAVAGEVRNGVTHRTPAARPGTPPPVAGAPYLPSVCATAQE